MSPRRTLLLPILLVALAAWCLPCAPAEARGGPRRDGQSAVEKLEPGELEVLRRKIPNWDELDRSKQERIAHGVIRFRSLSQEELKRLRERMDGLKGRGKPDRPSRAHWMRFAQGLGESIWSELPKAFHDEIAKRRIRPAMAKMVLSHKVRARIVEAEGRAFTRDNLQAFPAGWRKRAAQLVAVLDDEAADQKARQKARAGLGHLRAQLRMEALKNNLAAQTQDGRVPIEQFAAALRRTWPDAVDGLVAEVAKNPARFAEMIERRGHRGGPGIERLSGKLNRGELGALVFQLERAARQNWKKIPALQALADRVIRQVLVQEFKVDQATVDRLPPFSAPRKREQAMRGLLGRLLKRGDARRPGGWPGPRGPRNDDGRRGPGGRRPGAKDEDR